MAAIQLLLEPVVVHEIKEDIKRLSSKKKESSQERKLYKKENSSRREENKYSYFFSESDSQRAMLREQIRFLHLAYNFIKGVPYKKVEAKVEEGNQVLSWHCGRIFSLIKKYIPDVFVKEQIQDWVKQSDGS
jgi:hypothetical protein